MTVQASQVTTVSTDAVPKDQRSWVDAALVVPLNRTLDLLRALLGRGISLRTNVNAQIVEKKFVAPAGTDWSAARLDSPLELSGPVLGVQVLGCWTVDGAGHDVASVGGLSSPAWRSLVTDGALLFRLLDQPGLTAGTRYRLLLLLWGS